MLVRVVGDKLCGWRITTICDSTVGPDCEEGGPTAFVCFSWLLLMGRCAEVRRRGPSVNLKLKQNSSQLVIYIPLMVSKERS